MKINSFLDDNLKALNKTDPKLAVKLDKLVINSEFYQLVQKGSPEVNLALPKEKLIYYNPNKVLDSVREELKSMKWKNPKLVVMAGFGLGYHLAELENMHGRRIMNYLVIEKDLAVLKLGLSLVNLVSLIEKGKIRFVAGVASDGLFEGIYRHITNDYTLKFYAKASESLMVGGSYIRDKEYYKTAFKDFKNAMQQGISDHGNSPEDALVGISNIFENIDSLVRFPGINRIKDRFKGKPALIVAAGPSLDKNIKQIKDIQDKVVIFACDATLKPLLDAGIVPHFVGSIERIDLTVEFYKDLDKYGDVLKNITFVGMGMVRKQIYDLCRGYKMPVINLFRRMVSFRFLGLDNDYISFGKSVANMGFLFLHYIGSEKIILVGQDLAFSETGETHAEATAQAKGFEAKAKAKNKVAGKGNYLLDEMWVKGNYKDKVKTRRVWHLFLKAYEKDIEAYPGKVINATEGGAFIYGTEVLTLKETTEKYLKDKIENPIKTVFEFAPPYSYEESEANIEKVLANITTQEDYFDFIISQCDEGEALIEKFKEDLAEKTKDEAIPITDLGEEWLKNRADRLIELFTSVVNHKSYGDFFVEVCQAYVMRTSIKLYGFESEYENASEVYAMVIKHMMHVFPSIKGLVEISRENLVVARSVTEKAMKKLSLEKGE